MIARNRMIGCFQPDAHREEAATEVQMIVYDTDFKSIRVDIRGKGSSESASKLYERICGDMPWIFHEDYDSFLAQSQKSGYRRKLIKQMRDAGYVMKADMTVSQRRRKSLRLCPRMSGNG